MKSFFVIALLMYVLMGVYLYIQQRSFIYFPIAFSSSDLNQQVFVNEGIEIHVSVLNAGQDHAIMYFGGNAENVDYNATNFLQWFPEYTVYLVKYRGYGGSGGKPTEKDLYSDALYIYDELRREGYEHISVIGRSLGSGVATYLATHREIQKCILITPFDSIERIAQSQYPIYPINLLLKDKYNSYSRAKNITAHTLVITAEDDAIIPLSHTERLVNAFSIDVMFEVVEDADHNNISEFPRYQQVLSEFM